MENLSLNDVQSPPPPGGPGAGSQQQPPLGPAGLQIPPPAAPQQLPPQMFTTAAQLLDLTDKKLMVSLRDGRKLIGVLRSWDQFANLVLQSTIERIFIAPTYAPTSNPLTSPPHHSNQNSNSTTTPQPITPGLYADIPRGVFLVRGENVLLLGEIDLDKDDYIPEGYELAPVETVHALAKNEQLLRNRRDKKRVERLKELGFEGENVGEVLL